MSKLYAHRGMSNIYPENSIEAIKEVLKYDYIYGIELDVRMTKDKKFVIIHDADITLVSNGTGNVYDKTLDELKKYNFACNSVEYKKNYLTSFFSKDGKIIRKQLKKLKNKKSKILTLNTVLQTIKNKQLLIEIKYDKHHFDLDKFYNLIKKYDNKNVSIQSFSISAINYLKNKDKNLNLGIITSIINLEEKLKLDTSFISIDKNIIDKKIYNEINNKIINIWTVDSYSEIKKLKKELGNNIDNLNFITNNPNIIYKYLKIDE